MSHACNHNKLQFLNELAARLCNVLATAERCCVCFVFFYFLFMCIVLYSHVTVHNCDCSQRKLCGMQHSELLVHRAIAGGCLVDRLPRASVGIGGTT